MLKHLVSFISSLKLTVVCLSCALVLVFAGTLAQVHLGLWDAQKQYFHSAFVMWGPAGSSWKSSLCSPADASTVSVPSPPANVSSEL